MEEIKVGNFIRTPYHTIEKVLEIEKSKNKIYDDIVTTDKSCYGLNWLKRNGTKSSSDLISLVEEGDYVNGVEVVDLDDGKHLKFANDVSFVDVGISTYRDGHVEGIKSIVTKEQFEQMKYIVGDE
jgi:hypothetical protein